jgi:branched-chain amino acid transport system ATP-binding protein
MTGQPIISTCELSRHFGGLKAVDDVTIEIRKSEITSIIGPNGAGKSTLFNLMSGALPPTRGKVVLDGLDVTGLPTRRLQARGLARSFQITNLFPGSTVYENLRLAAQILQPWRRGFLPASSSVGTRIRVERLLSQFDLESSAGEEAGNLSHGEQRRLEIAVALACEPKIVMLDEPTQGMSHADTQETSALIRKVAEDVTVVLVEHDIDLVMDLSDRIIVLTQGRVLAEGAPDEIRRNADVQAAYLGGH